MKIVKKHRDITFVTNKQRKRLFRVGTKLSHKKWFSENFLAIKTINRSMKKPVYLVLSTLNISKTVKQYEF